MLNVIGFVIMLVLRRIKTIRFGDLMSFYLIWYGGVRIFIESMRTDPLTYELFGLTLKSATTTSILMILGGITLSLLIRIKFKGDSYGSVPGCIEFDKQESKEQQ
jgi:phosphatidylglycerol:prolipoprotein diacylglycerol transferase